jgi:hypothetical protein
MSDTAALHFFGIRHHGPGCARSLVRALDALTPDCVLVEGPPEADGLAALVTAEGMEPPVALLSWCPDETGWAVYHPFATFSPEWQALQWAARHGAVLRFIDLPRANDFALEKERRAKADEERRRQADADAASAGDDDEGGGEAPAATATSDAPDDAATGAPDHADAALDPLDWLARVRWR